MRPRYTTQNVAATVNRFTSPILQDDPPIYECPVGYILREAPYIYKLVDYLMLSERLSPTELAHMPVFYHRLLSVYHNELYRIDDVRKSLQKAKQNASYGADVLKRRKNGT